MRLIEFSKSPVDSVLSINYCEKRLRNSGREFKQVFHLVLVSREGCIPGPVCDVGKRQRCELTSICHTAQFKKVCRNQHKHTVTKFVGLSSLCIYYTFLLNFVRRITDILKTVPPDHQESLAQRSLRKSIRNNELVIAGIEGRRIPLQVLVDVRGVPDASLLLFKLLPFLQGILSPV